MNDNRKEIELELTDAEFLALARMAHEADITFNQMCEQILQDYINKVESGELKIEIEETQSTGRGSMSTVPGFPSPSDEGAEEPGD